MGMTTSRPDAPNYTYGTALDDKRAKSSAELQTSWNRPTQNNPYGQIQWEKGPNGEWVQNETWDPRLKTAADTALGTQQTQFDRLAGQGEFNAPTSPQYDPNAGNAMADAIYGSVMDRARPEQDRQQAALTTRLRQQGLQPGTEAFDRAMRNMLTSHGDVNTQAAHQARIAAGAESRAEYDSALRGQAQDYQQRQSTHLLPWQTATMSQELFNGARAPNFQDFKGAVNYSPGSMTDAAHSQYGTDLMGYNADQAKKGNLLNTGGQILGNVLGNPTGQVPTDSSTPNSGKTTTGGSTGMLAPLYSGNGVDSTGQFGYLGDLFSGGGTDGTGQYGLAGDLGGWFSGLFNQGSEGTGSTPPSQGFQGTVNNVLGGVADWGGSQLLNYGGSQLNQALGGGPLGEFGQRLFSEYGQEGVDALSGYLKGEGFDFQAPDLLDASTNIGGDMLKDYLGGQLNEALGGGIQGYIGGSLAKGYLDPAIDAGTSFLQGNGFDYQAPDLSSLTGGITSGLTGNFAGGAIADALRNAGLDPSLAGYAGNVGGQYLGSLAGNTISGLTGGATTGATTGAATGGTGAGGLASGSLGSMAVAALPIAMVAGSLAKGHSEKKAKSEEARRAQFLLREAGLRMTPDAGETFTAEQMRALDTRDVSPEYLDTLNWDKIAQQATRRSMVDNMYTLAPDMSQQQLSALLDPAYMKDLIRAGITEGVDISALQKPQSLVDALQGGYDQFQQFDSGEWVNPMSQATDPITKMMWENMQQLAPDSVSADTHRQSLIDSLGKYSDQDKQLIQQMAQYGLLSPEQMGIANQYILGV